MLMIGIEKKCMTMVVLVTSPDSANLQLSVEIGGIRSVYGGQNWAHINPWWVGKIVPAGGL